MNQNEGGQAGLPDREQALALLREFTTKPGLLKHAPHRDAAVKFLEYLASDEAQRYFADGNNEYPVVEGVAPNAALEALGVFKADPLNVAVLGEKQPAGQRIFDRVGWK